MMEMVGGERNSSLVARKTCIKTRTDFVKTLSRKGNSEGQHTELSRLFVSIHLSTGKI